jgi:hypothetical protein
MPDMSKNARQIRNRKYAIGGIVATAIILVIVGVAIYTPQSPLYIGEDPEQPETPLSESTFTLYSDPDGEDVSNFVEISVWVPEDDAEFDDTEDIFTMSNFEEEETSKDAEDVSIDLTDYSYVWVEIDPDGESVFATDFHLIYGGLNYDYTFYVKHQTSDVNFNLFDRDTLNEITVADYATDGNYTLIYDCPHYTTTNIHANSDDWACNDDDWDELTASEKEEYYDEKYWRGQFPTYSPVVDTEKDYDKDLEKLTNAFAFNITCNNTISTVDGNTAQLNITLDDDADVEVVISGTMVYLIYYSAVYFEDGAQELGMELEFGADITLSDIDSGRIVVPKDDSGLGTFTKYSDIAA